MTLTDLARRMFRRAARNQAKSPPTTRLTLTALEDRSVPYAVSGTVYFDANGDGMQNSGELGAPSVSVSLTPQGGTLQSAQTDASGKYSFSNIADGKHNLSIFPSSGYTVGMPVGGITDVYVAGMDATQNASLVTSPPPPPPPPGGGSQVDAVDDSVNTLERAPVVVSVLANDTGPQGFWIVSYTQPQSGTVTFDALTNTMKYAPDSGFIGADTFTYTITNAMSTDTASVNVTVAARLLGAPIDQAASEGSLVSVATPLSSGANGLTLAFGAVGLPAGLTIDSGTGVISGRPLYSAAQTNSGNYSVTVTATAGSTTDSVTYAWTINDTNRIQPITGFLTRTDTFGNITVVSGGPVRAIDDLDNDLTFSLGGINATATGFEDGGTPGDWSVVFSGPIANMSMTYIVTLTLTGGGATDTRTFNWQNVAAATTFVTPIVDDTMMTTDDYSAVGKSVHVGYQLLGGAAFTGGSITFSVFSGPATITGSTTVSFAADSSGIAYVYTSVTPTDWTVASNWIKIAGQLNDGLNPPVQLVNAVLAGIEVKISTYQNQAGNPPQLLTTPGKIRAFSTPAAMTKDRIPPRTNTSVMFEVKGDMPAGAGLKAVVAGESANNGTTGFVKSIPFLGGSFLIPGSVGIPLDLTGGGATTTIRGATQTVPGNDSKLIMTVVDNGNPAKESGRTGGFSVAAIPVGVKSEKGKELNPDLYVKNGVYTALFGAEYKVSFVSDSGEPDDLDKVDFKEVIQNKQGTGSLSKAGPASQDDYAPISKGKVDTFALSPDPFMSANAAQAKLDGIAFFLTDNDKAGTLNFEQYHLFRDNRTGETDIIMANSAYVGPWTLAATGQVNQKLTRTLDVEKTGKAVTVSGTNTVVAAASGGGKVSVKVTE